MAINSLVNLYQLNQLLLSQMFWKDFFFKAAIHNAHISFHPRMQQNDPNLPRYFRKKCVKTFYLYSQWHAAQFCSICLAYVNDQNISMEAVRD